MSAQAPPVSALIPTWKARRKELRRQTYGDPKNRRLLFARADELRHCIEELTADVDRVLAERDETIARLKDQLGECYKQAGADTDGDEN